MEIRHQPSKMDSKLKRFYLPFVLFFLAAMVTGEMEASMKTETQQIAGNWLCRMSINNIPLGNGAVSFTADGQANMGGQTFHYRLLPEGVLRLENTSGASDYRYTVSGTGLMMHYADGTVFDCTRQTTTAAPTTGGTPAIPGNAAGNEWQLQGGFCHYAGSSSYASSYSRLDYINFDGNGRWSTGSQTGFSSEAGLYAGGGGGSSGRYQIQGERILYQTDAGEQGVAEVYTRQDDGRITGIQIDGKIYSPSLCE